MEQKSQNNDGNVRNQILHLTKYNRYPEVFEEVRKIVEGNPKILSFGCSNGKECRTLNEMYYKESQIDGIDINDRLISRIGEKNKNEKIRYISNINDLSKYDLIFCMSVLCLWPENRGVYPFKTFENTLKIVDDCLNVGGYLCIYNSKYLFTDTDISKRYLPVETTHQISGQVRKYNKNGRPLPAYPYFLFKKIS